MKLKYVILEVGGVDLPLVFPSCFSHRDVLPAREAEVKSAGFCELNAAGRWVVGGESVALNRQSRPQDAVVLNSQIGINRERLENQ